MHVSVIFLADKGRTAQKIHRDRIILFEGVEKYWAYAGQQKAIRKVIENRDIHSITYIGSIICNLKASQIFKSRVVYTIHILYFINS